MLRHLARTAAFKFVYTYRENYNTRVTTLSELSLADDGGRLHDVTSIVLGGQFSVPLTSEDFLFTREPMPSATVNGVVAAPA